MPFFKSRSARKDVRGAARSRKELFKGPLAVGADSPAGQLREIRRARRKRLALNIKYTAGAAVASGTLLALATFKHHPGALREVAAITGFLSAVGFGVVSFASPGHERVAQATRRLGFLLGREAAQNTVLKGFLERHRYVYVDYRGRIVGTRRAGTPEFSRFRLETKTILGGGYKEERPLEDIDMGLGPSD